MWRGAALTRVSRSDGICSIACLAENLCEEGGSRELPSVSLLYSRTEPLGSNIALGDSREPPAFTFPRRTT